MKKITFFVLALILLTTITPGFAEEGLSEDNIYLHIGSPLILSNDNIKVVDSENPDVVPTIYKDKTLIPLRAVSEHFSAEVDYDNELREAYIYYNDIKYIFPIDKDYYRVEESGKKEITKKFDTETLIIENRTMVPLRIIAEDVFGKKVGYKDKVIIIGDKETIIEDENVNEIKSKIGQAIKPSTKEELKNFIANLSGNEIEKNLGDEGDISSEPSQEEAADSRSSDDFSQTNEQVEGINEADIVKTDGKFIYVVSNKSIRVYNSNNGKPFLTDEIIADVDDTGSYMQFTEIYIDSEKLIVLGIKNQFDNWIRPIPQTEPNIEMEEVTDSYYRTNESYVYSGVYNVDSEGNLNLEKEMEVEGSLLSSRKKDNYVYLVVNKYLYNYYDNDLELPMYRDTTVSKDYMELAIDNILYFPKRRASNYLMVAAFNIEKTVEPIKIEAFLGSGTIVYMSNNYLYIAGQNYNNIWGNITNIARFSVDKGKIGYTGGGMVEGNLLNQFSMDEYKNNLRIATTNWKGQSTNSLYILDENLNKKGEIKNIALGERIYSVRFLQDRGYIVTFRQIDPLFVIDMSDPTNPQITGELKVPGFSNYLHPIGENALLGIGKDIEEDTGRDKGIKLSLFDISDDGKPIEINTLILGDSGSYAEVLNNHKALMLNMKKDMIAFDAKLTNVLGEYEKEYFN